MALKPDGLCVYETTSKQDSIQYVVQFSDSTTIRTKYIYRQIFLWRIAKK
jgi:hypothetical protein